MQTNRIAEAVDQAMSDLLTPLQKLKAVTAVANKCAETGDNTKAAKLHAGVLKARKQLLPDQHPDITDAMNNLAVAYVELGHYQKARARFFFCSI